MLGARDLVEDVFISSLVGELKVLPLPIYTHMRVPWKSGGTTPLLVIKLFKKVTISKYLLQGERRRAAFERRSSFSKES